MARIVAIDNSICIFCGVCVRETPAVFSRDEDGRIIVRGSGEVEPQVMDDLLETMEDCPVGAIYLTEKN